MAKSSKTPLKASTKGVKAKDDKTTESKAKKATQAVSSENILNVEAKVAFYDMAEQKQRKVGDKWSEKDNARIQHLLNLGFIAAI